MKISNLPEEVKQRAKANREEWNKHCPGKLDKQTNDLEFSFNYSRTPEGEDYWRYWEKQELPPVYVKT